MGRDSLEDLATDQLEAFGDMFDGSSKDLGKISIAFYSGLWSFNGWNYLNIVAGELKNPERCRHVTWP